MRAPDATSKAIEQRARELRRSDRTAQAIPPAVTWTTSAADHTKPMSFKPRHFVWLAIVLILGGVLLFLNHERSQTMSDARNETDTNGVGGARDDDRDGGARFDALFGKDATEIEVLEVLPIGADGRVRLRAIDRHQIARPRVLQSQPAADPGDNADDDNADGDNADGDNADGDNADGDTADGDTADGDNADGDNADASNDGGGANVPVPATRDPEVPIIITLVGLTVPEGTIDGKPARDVSHAWFLELITGSDRVLAQRDEQVGLAAIDPDAPVVHWRYVFLEGAPIETGPHASATRRLANEMMLHFGYAELSDDADLFGDVFTIFYMKKEADAHATQASEHHD